MPPSVVAKIALLLAEVVGRLDIQVELSGGIRDDDSLKRALATGCRRVNLGTAALENPEWTSKVIAEFGDRIAVGLDVRGHTLAARGWTEEGGDLFETIARLERDGCARYVVTDVTKDGTLKGPNLELLKEVCAVTKKPVIASGGISSSCRYCSAQCASRNRCRRCNRWQGSYMRELSLWKKLWN